MKNTAIASSLEIWNEYFNVDAMMTDADFYSMTFDERLKMLIEAFGEDD